VEGKKEKKDYRILVGNATGMRPLEGADIGKSDASFLDLSSSWR
jgi:hypothetical protein